MWNPKRLANNVRPLPDVQQYLRATQPNTSRGRFDKHKAPDEYWQIIGQTLLSRCPYCSLQYTSWVDTLSLDHAPQGYSEFGSLPQQRRPDYHHCVHAVAFDEILFDGFGFFSRVTHHQLRRLGIQTHLAPDELDCKIVMHAIPIHQIIGERFELTHTCFVLGYFCAQGRTPVMDLWKASIPQQALDDPEYYTTLIDYEDQPRDRDLKAWVKRGKLLWLNLDDPQFSTLYGDVDQFPYSGLSDS